MNDSLRTWIRDEVRNRRVARAARHRLANELATYETPGDVEDLLASLNRESGPEVEDMRTILTANVRLRQHLMAS